MQRWADRPSSTSWNARPVASALAAVPDWLVTKDVDLDKLTPVMRQVVGFKRDRPDCLIFFRLGDFYELFFEDALVAAPLLDMVLTSRNKRDERPIPMCGFPYHAMASYVQRSLQGGLRVAVVEQLGDPRKSKGPVERGLTRVITPGVVLESEALDGKRSNNVIAIVGRPGSFGVAAADASTGEFTMATTAHAAGLSVLLVRLEPREIVAGAQLDAVLDGIASARELLRTHRDPERDMVRRHAAAPERLAAELLRGYLAEVRPSAVGLLGTPTALKESANMALDRDAVTHLEILATARAGRREGSLLAAVDRTVTTPGARLLRSLLLAPLCDRASIEGRHAAVQALVNDGEARRGVRTVLSGSGDLARIVGRTAAGMVTPKELVVGRDVLASLPGLRELLAADELQAPVLRRLREALSGGVQTLATLQAMLAEDPGASVPDGGVIAPGYCAQLDEYRVLCDDGDGWLQRYEAQLREESGNPKLRARFHRVAGYIIEIARSRSDDVPDYFRRVGTLKNVERFTTVELAEFEQRMLAAAGQRLERETELYLELCGAVTEQAGPLRAIAAALAELDLHAAFAEYALERGCCKPELVDTMDLQLVASRHPVIEQLVATGSFVPNDVELRADGTRILLLTGPNMAGKSTLMRQVALCSIVCQAGGFVPCEHASMPVFDAVMTRIGASDDISEGASTFMVEMRETAHILGGATERSLVLLDEVGRGTSTHDGLAIAWATIEALHDDVGAMCLFATHYHELTELAEHLQHLANAHVAVREFGDEMVFIHRLAPGPTNRSHGIAVARLAGLPDSTLARATEVLAKLEQTARTTRDSATVAPRQLSLFAPAPMPAKPDPRLLAWIADIAGVDLDELSPRQAHELLAELAAQARGFS